MYNLNFNIHNQEVTIDKSIFAVMYSYLDTLGLDTDIVIKNDENDRNIKNPDGSYNNNFSKWFDHIDATYSYATTMDTNRPYMKGPERIVQTESGISVSVDLFKYSVSIGFVVYTKSKSALVDLKNKLLDNRIGNSYPLASVYTYVYLADEILDLLAIDYKYRNEVEPLTTEEYFEKILSGSFTLLTSQDRLFKELAYRYRLDKVMIKQNEDTDIKIAYDKDTGFYSLEISIEAKLDLPRKFKLEYYPVIYSQLLPDEWQDITKEPEVKPVDSLLSKLFSTRKIPFKYIPKVFESGYLSIPANDCCKLPDIDGYNNFLSGLTIPVSIEVDGNDYTSMDVSLTDLGDVKLNPVVEEYVYANRDTINSPYRNFLIVNVYKDFEPISHKLYYIDDNLNIILREPFDMKCVYHFTLAIAGDGILNVVKNSYDYFRETIKDKYVNLASRTGGEELSGDIDDQLITRHKIDLDSSVFNDEYIYKIAEARKKDVPKTQQNAYTIAHILKGV